MGLFTLHPVSKFAHVLAATIWVGGVITLGIVNARLAREKDPGVMASFARQSRFFGQAVMGPAAASPSWPAS